MSSGSLRDSIACIASSSEVSGTSTFCGPSSTSRGLLDGRNGFGLGGLLGMPVRGSSLHELWRPPLLERDDDDIQVPRHDGVGEDGLRLALDLAAEVAVGEMRESEHPDLCVPGHFRRLERRRVERLVRALPLLLREGRLVHEQIGAPRRIDDRA